jgi:hypothetical protein
MFWDNVSRRQVTKLQALAVVTVLRALAADTARTYISNHEEPHHGSIPRCGSASASSIVMIIKKLPPAPGRCKRRLFPQKTT